MPDNHWIALTISRIEGLLFDSVASKWMDETVRETLLRERQRLIDLHTKNASE